MKNKRFIVFISLVCVAMIFVFALFMKKEKTYSLNNDNEIKLAISEVLDISLEKNKAYEMYKEKYSYQDVSYYLTGIKDDENVYFALFIKEQDETYRNIYQWLSDETLIFHDKDNDTFLVAGYEKIRNLPLEITLQYEDGHQKTQALTIYHKIVQFVSDPKLKSIQVNGKIIEVIDI